jgi:hypothetical protein
MRLETAGAVTKPTTKRIRPKPESVARHESHCTVCANRDRAEIDLEFVNWTSPTRIATWYRISRDALYRHVHATGLLLQRQRNVRMALEKIIEKAGEVEVNAGAVVNAVAAYARINTAGQWVERSETLNLNELFGRMSRVELEDYAANGKLPAWFPAKPQQESGKDVS